MPESTILSYRTYKVGNKKLTIRLAVSVHKTSYRLGGRNLKVSWILVVLYTLLLKPHSSLQRSKKHQNNTPEQLFQVIRFLSLPEKFTGKVVTGMTLHFMVGGRSVAIKQRWSNNGKLNQLFGGRRFSQK